MEPAPLTRIAIIGAGASGSLLAVQLCRLAGTAKLEVLLFDTAAEPGPGLAYATRHPLHLLNVPAGRMSAFPDEPNHFLNWLSAQKTGYSADDFVPRGVYGRYLSALIADLLLQPPQNATVCFIRQEVTEIAQVGMEYRLQTASGKVFTAHKVALALGNFSPAHPCKALAALPAGAPYFQNPWLPALFDSVNAKATVLLVGTGLTMADVLMSLHERQHSGPVIAVSTHGYLPAAHQKSAPYEGVNAAVANVPCVNQWLRYIRQHVQLAQRQGINWRAVIDAFRPYSQAFWLQLPVAEKRRFMRHLRHIWAVSRHRMPPLSAEIMQAMQASGQLTVKAARVSRATYRNGKIYATIRHTKTHKTETLAAELVMNCTGPAADYRKIISPLLHSLLQSGLAKTDALHMGFLATPDGHLLNAQHKPSDNLYGIGPPLKGVLWESTAIPEIREQAHTLARLLLQKQ